MASIPQSQLLSWEVLDASPDLMRFELVLASIPDEPLMTALEKERKGVATTSRSGPRLEQPPGGCGV